MFRQVLPASYEEIYAESGDAEAFGLSEIFCTYKFVAGLFMLSDVLHTVATASNHILTSAFSNLATSAVSVSVIPVTTCMVERSFSHMKTVNTRSRWNRLEDETLHML